MKLKKILASLTAAALAVTTMAFAPVSVSAEALKSTPEGIRTVLASANLSKVKTSFTSSYENGDWVQIEGVDSSWMTDADVYVEMKMSNIGKVSTDDGLKSYDTLISWGWENYSSWATVVKWYNNDTTDTTANFEAAFVPNSTSTSESAVAYLPISDFKRTSWGGIAGNIQSGAADAVTIDSLSIVKIEPGEVPYKGSVMELPTNSWTDNSTGETKYNWQGTLNVNQTEFADGMTMAKVYEKASTIKVSFKANGATSGTNLKYDISQISWQMRLSCCDSATEKDWPWLVGGTYTYEDGVVTISADLSSLVDKKYINDKYVFKGISIVGAAAKETATEKIKLYYEDLKVSLVKTVPAESITVDPVKNAVNVGETFTVKATVLPANTTDEVVFSSSDTTVATVGAASGVVTAVAPGEATITATAGSVSAECKVTVEKNTFAVNVSTDETMGTASAAPAEAAEGTDVTLTAKANDGYRFVKWNVVSPESLVITDNKFTMPAEAVEVTAVFEEDSYALTVTSDENGTASAKVDGAAAPAKVVAGKKVSLSAEPKDGYRFVKWTVTGVTLEDDTAENVTFTMPASAVTAKAAFEEIPAGEHAVTVKTADGGTASASKKSAVKDTEIELTVKPETGYEFDKWIVSPETVVITNNKFTMPDEAVTITPVFKKSTYNVEVEVTVVGGDASVNKPLANMGDIIEITVKPADGYEVEKITVNGEKLDGTTFTMPAKNVIVSVAFKNLPGTADAEVVAPDGVDIGFAGSKEDVLAAVFGENYAKYVEDGAKLDVVMTVKDESAVSDGDKEILKSFLSDGQKIGLILDIALVSTYNGDADTVVQTNKPISFSISVPDSIIADGRIYSVVRIHGDEAMNIGGTFDSATKTITVSSDLFSTYAIVYEEEEEAEEIVPEPTPVVIYYNIATDSHANANVSTAAAGTVVTVRTDFGYDAEVYCGGARIAVVSDRDSFVMPAGNVRIISVDNGYISAMKKALPNSYIFVYDSDMNYIKTNGSTRGLNGEGRITVKLGEEYAGKTITLYKGRKNTSVKVASKTLNEDGNASFIVSAGMNYTAVVE
ncbi:MAG: Ig-like domain-containing protein [Oscillospiraceae bacterium]|nr:Ig-like domain-containing protein [Oscillospiraceae bacterium]